MKEKKLALYEEFKNCLEDHERDYLERFAHLYKDTDTTIYEISSLHTKQDFYKKLLGLLLDLEQQSLIDKGEWERPKVIDENDTGWKYEDGLWYEKDVYVGYICPLCSNASIIHWINGVGYGVCFDCELAWDSGHPKPKRWPDFGDPTDEEIKAGVEIQKKILSFQRAEDIYGKSKIINKVMMDINVRRLREDIEHVRTRKERSISKVKEGEIDW